MSSLGHAIAKSGPLSQFVLGCFLLTGGYVEREVLERRFDARAAVALADATGHCHEAADSDDPWTVARLALALEEIARRHGLVTRVEESATRTQHKAAAEHDAKQATEGVDTVRMLSPIVHDSQSYQDTRRSAEDAVQRGPADVASEESTEQLLRASHAPQQRPRPDAGPGTPSAHRTELPANGAWGRGRAPTPDSPAVARRAPAAAPPAPAALGERPRLRGPDRSDGLDYGAGRRFAGRT